MSKPDAFTTVTWYWDDPSVMGCRNCSRPGVYRRVMHTKKRKVESIDISAYCEVHVPAEVKLTVDKPRKHAAMRDSRGGQRV